ncbi:MAG: hypothetical protein A2586_01945 [Candidatus Harrisonbacteria bacterium RIFOXYD1_FULL_40_9]|uniref:DUF3987 domain-containing protein n=1 Tax=Candidatus Harrisonbacteria bacterium RIFOXYD1_FULL_40_9 TaxID=1798412 RepID=A0A1G1ZY79_9BACT|nr:MAG: hypothetical protein A2586_01945 [Candidatus Harrisonbacteria bacterium RIFOXYD1_FULL_40_9]
MFQQPNYEKIINNMQSPEEIKNMFPEMSVDELADVLSLTIKKDYVSKIICALGMILAFTEDSQINISFNAPSSTGKSHTPLEIAQLFPDDSLERIGSASPTSFFHRQDSYNKEKNETLVNLERKIIIVYESLHQQLLEKLRSLLSHDKKEIVVQITDRTEKGGHRTKNVILRGHCVMIFCSASNNFDEQELTRFIMLSPDIDVEKFEEVIDDTIEKAANPSDYKKRIENDPRRISLRNRILAIRDERIDNVVIPFPKEVKSAFSSRHPSKIPRHMRDIKKLISLIKAIALLNLFQRKRDEANNVIAEEKDFNEALKLWDKISEAQDLNIPPYILKVFNDVVMALYKERLQSRVSEDPVGLTRNEVLKKHHEVFNRPLSAILLRQQFIPMWEAAGLMYQEPDSNNQRQMLIYPSQTHDQENEKDIPIDGII